MEEFLSNTLKLANQVAILFIIMIVGIIVTKIKLIDKKGIDSLVNILLYVVTPCVIVNSFLNMEFTSSTFSNLLIATGCALVSHIIGLILSLFIRDKDVKKQTIYQFGTMFSNGGYMGLPLAGALFGNEGIFYASAYVVVFNIVQWTYGISLFQKGKASGFKALINPGTVAVAIGLPLFFFKVKFPEIIGSPIEYLSTLNTPVPMIITGYYLATSPVFKGLLNIKTWITVALKNIIMPLIAFIVFKYGFSLSGVLLSCTVVSASAPSAVNTMVLASKFNSDTTLGSQVLAISTCLSIITMPLLLALTL